MPYSTNKIFDDADLSLFLFLSFFLSFFLAFFLNIKLRQFICTKVNFPVSCIIGDCFAIRRSACGQHVYEGNTNITSSSPVSEWFIEFILSWSVS